ICRVPDLPHRFRKAFLGYIEFVGPVLNFMGLEQADSASILRTPVGEIIWHGFSPLEATRWRVGKFPALPRIAPMKTTNADCPRLNRERVIDVRAWARHVAP